jgi:hypothetical protein
VLARLSGAKRAVAVAAVTGFAALVGTVAWAGARGSSAPAAAAGGGAGVTRQTTPQGPDGFFDDGGGYGFGGRAGAGQGWPAAGSSGAS